MSARRLLPLALVATLAGPALAESTVAAGTPQATAVAIMRDSGQALLWDSARGEYLLVKAGDHFQGYFVVTIGDEAVVVAEAHDASARHVLRLAPAPTSRPGKRALRPTVITLAPSEAGGAALDIIDPYPADGLEVVDPYGPAASKVAQPAAPSLQPDPSVREVRAPTRSAIDEPRTPPAALGVPSLEALEAAKTAKSAEPAKPVATAKPKLVERTIAVKRADLDTALSDFDALAREIQVERAEGGGVHVVGLSRGSFFHRSGLRERDLVRAVAGVRLTTIESAAMVYARVQASDEFDVEIERGAQRVILTFAVQ